MEKKDKKKEKQDSILDASLPLFARKGFNGTNVAEIAQKAGIGKGTIYEYFESKKDIFINLLERLTKEINESLGSTLNEKRCPEDRLSAIIDWNIELMNKLDSDISKLFLEMVNQTITKGGVFYEDRSLMEELSGGLMKTIRDIILDGVSEGVFKPSVARSADNISLNLCAYLDGTAIYFLMNKPTLKEYRSMIDLFLKGVLNSLKK